MLRQSGITQQRNGVALLPEPPNQVQLRSFLRNKSRFRQKPGGNMQGNFSRLPMASMLMPAIGHGGLHLPVHGGPVHGIELQVGLVRVHGLPFKNL